MELKIHFEAATGLPTPPPELKNLRKYKQIKHFQEFTIAHPISWNGDHFFVKFMNFV